MKEQVEQMKATIKQALLKGDYKFIKCGECTADITIDGCAFQVWIENEPKEHFDIYAYESFLSQVFTSHKDRLTAWRKIKPLVDEYRNGDLRTEKLAELKKLQKEIVEIPQS